MPMNLAMKNETYLTKRLEGMKVSKPDVSGVEMELDSRFVSVDFESSTSFDIWLKLSSIGGKRKILLPLKRHKHFNSLFSEGKLLGGVRLGNKSVTFNFECVQPDTKRDGSVLGGGCWNEEGVRRKRRTTCHIRQAWTHHAVYHG